MKKARDARRKGQEKTLPDAHRHEGFQEEVGATSGQTHKDVLERTVGRERAMESSAKESAD